VWLIQLGDRHTFGHLNPSQPIGQITPVTEDVDHADRIVTRSGGDTEAKRSVRDWRLYPVRGQPRVRHRYASATERLSSAPAAAAEPIIIELIRLLCLLHHLGRRGSTPASADYSSPWLGVKRLAGRNTSPRPVRRSMVTSGSVALESRWAAMAILPITASERSRPSIHATAWMWKPPLLSLHATGRKKPDPVRPPRQGTMS
jgi:hypothetical protein